MNITRQDVHRLIFLCCNYDTDSERLCDMLLQGYDEEQARQILEAEKEEEDDDDEDGSDDGDEDQDANN